MRYLLSQHIPPFRRVLLVESGSRYLIEHLLPGLYKHNPGLERVDLVTCYPGLPKGFDESRGVVYRVTDYLGRPARKGFYQKLRGEGYNILGIVCSGEPIMTKWKWALTAQVPAKTFLLNENGDYFWLDRSNLAIVRHFILYRAGLTGAGAVNTLVRMALFPFTLAYLLLYAATAHLSRRVRI